jgi:hypothetical protein
MKNILLMITLLLLISVNTQAVNAQTKTTTSTKTQTTTQSASPSAAENNKAGLEEKLNDQVNKLKDKIASRVSELNLVEKRGVIGTVTEASANKITVTDPEGKTRFIDVDEITKFTSATNKATFSISDITKGTKIAVIGLYNKESKRLLARFIQLTVDPQYVQGTISAVDKKNFQVTITTEDQKQQLVDIVTTTKITSYDKDAGLVKAGFSALQVGDRATAIGYTDKKDPNLLVASRLMNLVGLPRNPKIVVQEQPASDSAKPEVSTTPAAGASGTTKISPARTR